MCEDIIILRFIHWTAINIQFRSGNTNSNNYNYHNNDLFTQQQSQMFMKLYYGKKQSLSSGYRVVDTDGNYSALLNANCFTTNGFLTIIVDTE